MHTHGIAGTPWQEWPTRVGSERSLSNRREGRAGIQRDPGSSQVPGASEASSDGRRAARGDVIDPEPRTPDDVQALRGSERGTDAELVREIMASEKGVRTPEVGSVPSYILGALVTLESVRARMTRGNFKRKKITGCSDARRTSAKTDAGKYVPDAAAQ